MVPIVLAHLANGRNVLPWVFQCDRHGPACKQHDGDPLRVGNAGEEVVNGLLLSHAIMVGSSLDRGVGGGGPSLQPAFRAVQDDQNGFLDQPQPDVSHAPAQIELGEVMGVIVRTDEIVRQTVQESIEPRVVALTPEDRPRGEQVRSLLVAPSTQERALSLSSHAQDGDVSLLLPESVRQLFPLVRATLEALGEDNCRAVRHVLSGPVSVGKPRRCLQTTIQGGKIVRIAGDARQFADTPLQLKGKLRHSGSLILAYLLLKCRHRVLGRDLHAKCLLDGLQEFVEILRRVLGADARHLGEDQRVVSLDPLRNVRGASDDGGAQRQVREPRKCARARAKRRQILHPSLERGRSAIP